MRIHLIAVAGLALAVAGCGNSHRDEGGEVKMTLDQVPPAVRETITREAGGSPVGEIEREQENGRTVYEAAVTTGGKKVEIKVDGDGKLLGRENEDD